MFSDIGLTPDYQPPKTLSEAPKPLQTKAKVADLFDGGAVDEDSAGNWGGDDDDLKLGL